jgi:serine/threonine-protein kinase
MGEVYAAEDADGNPVAIKFLREDMSDEPELVARFKREAKIASRIQSPYVAAIVGTGKTAQGRLWIAFERLTGETLDARIRRVHYLPMKQAAWIIEHVLEGLHAAHSVGVIHRDVKPANVFLESLATAQRARLLDFGIAKARVAITVTSDPALTTANETLGTLSFMPPEQVGGAAAVDHRADLYAAGVVAFLGLTGQLPFVGRTASAVLYHKCNADALSLAEVTGTRWPDVVERWFARVLAREAEGRFASATDTLEAWREASRARAPSPSSFRNVRPILQDAADTEVSTGASRTEPGDAP